MRRYAIIAGTEKAGTTSAYHYLNAHPDVLGSIRKETDFFRSPGGSKFDYDACFPEGGDHLVRMEASPGYLADSQVVAVELKRLLPQARIAFILRDPVDRLLSSFRFHKSRLMIPVELQFEDYLDLCWRYERQEISARQAGLSDWVLRVPEAGLYAKHLAIFGDEFPRHQLMLLSFRRLTHDPQGVMKEICSWLGIDGHYFEAFDFNRSNVTFMPKSLTIQQLALWLNSRLEPFFLRQPRFKRSLLSVYKRFNSLPVESVEIPKTVRSQLVSYYSADTQRLRDEWGFFAVDYESWLAEPSASQA